MITYVKFHGNPYLPATVNKKALAAFSALGSSLLAIEGVAIQITAYCDRVDAFIAISKQLRTSRGRFMS